MSWKPACFDSHEQWDGWRLQARYVPPNARDGFCEDCTPTYKAKMVKEQRCMHKGVKFVIRRVGGGLDISGERPRKRGGHGRQEAG